MFKSVFLGTLWGALVAGLGLVSASIIVPLPEGLRPEQGVASISAPPAPLPALAPDDIAPPAPVVPEPQAVAPEPEPQVPPAPSPDSVPAVPEVALAEEEPRADTDPPTEPASEGAPANPDALAAKDLQAEAMVEAEPEPVAPEAVPPEASSDIAPAPVEQAIAEPAPEPLPETPAPDQTTAAAPEPAAPAEETAAAAPEPAAPAQETATTAPEPSPPAQETTAAAPEPAPPAQETNAAEPEPAPPPRLMQPVPRLGASSDPAANPTDVSDLPLELVPPLPPLDRNAEPFENPEARPVLVLLLRDDPDFDGDISALAGFNVTLVIDPDHPQAPGRAQMWRAAGVEVALLATGLPSSTQASDFEVALEVLESSLPQALAFVADPEGVFQDDRARANAAALALAVRGYGLVTWEKGLNPADQAARRADLPATRIFRAIDAEGESVPNIRRALDRAVFKATQDGQVVSWGHLRPQTLQALAEWSQTARAGQVVTAPLSAVLRGAAP